ncbi:MAG: hypothetical protein J2P15_14765 [Micromonosporaceae bacterium]|nr:hypothetical protein [Micromonosporaceae bacterium]
MTVGVLYQYFRVRDDEAAVALMVMTGGGPVVQHGDESVVDAIDAKGIDPPSLLGQLVAVAANVEWTVELIEEELIWQIGLREDPEYEGPWVSRLGDPARDTLAAIAEESIDNLATEWAAQAESWGGAGADVLRPLVADLMGLARRAGEAGEHLYCWSCL